MINFKRKIGMAAALILLIISLVACSGFSGDGGNDQPLDQPVRYSQIIIDSTDLNILDIRNAVTDITGMIPVVLYGDSELKDG